MKLAIVTGASSGIGNRIAEVFMGEKAMKCILISRSKPQNLDLAGWIQCDLAKHSEFPELFSVKRFFFVIQEIQRLEKSFGTRTSVLVNAAGASFDKLLFQTDEAAMQNILALNLMAPMLLSRGILKSLLRTQGNQII